MGINPWAFCFFIENDEIKRNYKMKLKDQIKMNVGEIADGHYLIGLGYDDPMLESDCWKMGEFAEDGTEVYGIEGFPGCYHYSSSTEEFYSEDDPRDDEDFIENDEKE
jgi:hypothetical protein